MSRDRDKRILEKTIFVGRA